MRAARLRDREAATTSAGPRARHRLVAARAQDDVRGRRGGLHKAREGHRAPIPQEVRQVRPPLVLPARGADQVDRQAATPTASAATAAGAAACEQVPDRRRAHQGVVQLQRVRSHHARAQEDHQEHHASRPRQEHVRHRLDHRRRGRGARGRTHFFFLLLYVLVLALVVLIKFPFFVVAIYREKLPTRIR